MEKDKYDIFISYRRIGGKNYARTLKPELEKRGFRVFLDFDELKDGVFDKRIMDAINEAPIFLVILSKGALDRCANDGDWVREEILYADKTKRHIVPIEVDKTFRDFPENLPQEVKSVLGSHQFSQIDTETLLQESIDKMVRERIKPYVTKVYRSPSPLEEESTEGAEIHIEVDVDCELYRFKKLLKTLYAGKDNVVHLMPGKHKIEVVSKEYADIKDSQVISIPSIQYSDFIEISLSERIESKKQEEIKRQEEQRRREEAKRKAEEDAKRKADETKRKAEYEAWRKAEEEEERRKLAEEFKRKAEEKKRKEEAAAKRGAEEEKRRAEEEAKRKIEDQHRFEEEKRLRLEKLEHIQLHPVVINSKQGYADESGKIVIPCKWSYAGEFSEGLAVVMDASEGKGYGFIDKSGAFVFQEKWYGAGDFSKGLAPVRSEFGYNYINKKGEIVLQGNWYSANAFLDSDLAWVKKEQGWYMIDTTGNRVTEFFKGNGAGDGGAPYYIDGLAMIESEAGFGFVDIYGKVVVPPQWGYGNDRFSEGLCVIKDKNTGKYGFIDRTGGLVIPCIWIDAYNFGEGLAAVMNEKYKWGFINKKGEIVIPCKWNSVEDKEHHIFGKVGFIDGEIIVEGKKNGKWYETVGKYVIDKRGNVIKEL